LAGINLRAMLGNRALPLLLQYFSGAETQISLALAQQTLCLLAINFEAIGLAIRAIISGGLAAGSFFCRQFSRAGLLRDCVLGEIGPFIPIQAEPLEIIEELLLEAGLAALEVSILDAHDHHAFLLARE